MEAPSSSSSPTVAVLNELISQLKTLPLSPVKSAHEFLCTSTDDLLKFFSCHQIHLSFDQIEKLKSEYSMASLSRQSIKHWSDFSPLVKPHSSHSRVAFGNSDLDLLLPTISHPAVIELTDTPHSDSDSIGHVVGIMLAVASAACGSNVMLLDTGLGTEIEELLMRRCSEYSRSLANNSDGLIEDLLTRIHVQRCFDPFSLVETLSSILKLPNINRPDVLIIMDWTKATIPFMTDLDLDRHKRQSGKNRTTERHETLEPIVAEIALILQSLATPRDSTVSKEGIKSTSVVVLNTHCLPSLAAYSIPFKYILKDIVDYSLCIKSQAGTEQKCLAELARQPDTNRFREKKVCVFQPYNPQPQTGTVENFKEA